MHGPGEKVDTRRVTDIYNARKSTLWNKLFLEHYQVQYRFSGKSYTESLLKSHEGHNMGIIDWQVEPMGDWGFVEPIGDWGLPENVPMDKVE